MKKFILPSVIALLLIAAGVVGVIYFQQAKTTPETTSATPTPVTTTLPETDQLPTPGLLSETEVKALVTDKLTSGMATITFFAGGFDVDLDQSLPGDPAYKLVNHSQLSTIQSLYDFAYDVYPPALAEEEFYLSDSTTGDMPRFKEYNGFLYANTDIGGRGVSSDWHTDTMEIISQSPESITVAMDLYRFDEFDSRPQLTLQKNDAGNWVFTSKIDL